MGNTTFSEQDLEILQQNQSQHDCGSVVESDNFCHSFGTLAQGINSAPENSWEKHREANLCQTKKQNATPYSVTPTSHYHYNKDINADDDSLHHIEAELCKKRQELATAKSIVSKLSTEVKLLEEAFAKRRRHHPRRTVFEVTPKPKIGEKRGNDGAPRLVKRLKQKATVPNFELESLSQSNEKREVCCLQDCHVTALENTSPTTVDGKERSSDQCLTQNNDTIASDYGSTALLSTPKTPDLLFTQAVQSLGDCLPRSGTDKYPSTFQHLNKGDLTQSLAIQTPWSECIPLDQSNSTLKEVSGFTSPNSGLLNCRASSVGFMDDLDETIAWVA